MSRRFPFKLVRRRWPLLAAFAGTGLLSALAFAWMRAVMVMVAVALGGCAALPGRVDKPVTHARPAAAKTELARVVAASTPADAHGLSGLRLLADDSDALQVRLRLARSAHGSLDIQYYQIADDRTGREFLDALRDAAARGVRVRLLVDDLYAGGEDSLFAALDNLPNAEVRLFNPLPVRGDRFLLRVALSLHEFSRINHRMHNKLFVADGALAVVGGRNIADEYFGRSAHANFIDADALVCGPVVGELEGLFDSFWNSPYAYPVRALGRASLPGDELKPVAVSVDAASAQQARELPTTTPGIVGELAAGRVAFDFGHADVVADDPSKVAGDGRSEGAPAADARALLERARSSAFVSTPYFIPGEGDLASLAEARRAGVDVQILTNSLQSTDEPVVYLGFERHAAALARLGVEVHEIRARQAGESSRGSGAGTPASGLGLSLSRLHAKLMVVDQRWSSIGSFNWDRRSALWNTELLVRTDSASFAKQLEGWARSHVVAAPTLDDTNDSPRGGAPTRGATWWQRAARALVADSLL